MNLRERMEEKGASPVQIKSKTVEIIEDIMAEDAGVIPVAANDRAKEIGVLFVNCIDEDECRRLLFRAHIKRFLGADRESSRCGSDYDCAVRRVKCRDHFAFEVEESRNVQDVDLAVAIERIAK